MDRTAPPAILNRMATARSPTRTATTTAPSPTLTDRFDRVHSYLRISLAERCNFRCTYSDGGWCPWWWWWWWWWWW